MYGALLIAKYVIAYENQNNRIVSNLRLQKLLYFIQAQFLVYASSACFSEKIEAWDFGPVVPIVYQKYKIYGSASIPSAISRSEIESIGENDRSMIDGILELASNYSTSALVQITHQQKPWLDAHNRYGNQEISLSSIKSFFGGKR